MPPSLPGLSPPQQQPESDYFDMSRFDGLGDYVPASANRQPPVDDEFIPEYPPFKTESDYFDMSRFDGLGDLIQITPEQAAQRTARAGKPRSYENFYDDNDDLVKKYQQADREMKAESPVQDWVKYFAKRSIPGGSTGYQIADLEKARVAANKLETEPLSGEDAYALAKQLNEMEDDQKRTGLKYAGNIAAEMPAYYGEMIATLGTGAVARQVVTKALTKMVANRLAKQTAKRWAARQAIGATAKTAQVAAQTALQPLQMMKSTVNRNLQQTLAHDPESLGVSALHGVGQTGRETATEMLVGKAIQDLVGKGTGFIAAKLAEKTPTLDKLRQRLVDKWVATIPGRTLAEGWNKVANKTGWNGLLPEMGEERVNEILMGLAGEMGATGSEYEFGVTGDVARGVAGLPGLLDSEDEVRRIRKKEFDDGKLTPEEKAILENANQLSGFGAAYDRLWPEMLAFSAPGGVKAAAGGVANYYGLGKSQRQKIDDYMARPDSERLYRQAVSAGMPAMPSPLVPNRENRAKYAEAMRQAAVDAANLGAEQTQTEGEVIDNGERQKVPEVWKNGVQVPEVPGEVAASDESDPELEAIIRRQYERANPGMMPPAGVGAESPIGTPAISPTVPKTATDELSQRVQEVEAEIDALHPGFSDQQRTEAVNEGQSLEEYLSVMEGYLGRMVAMKAIQAKDENGTNEQTSAPIATTPPTPSLRESLNGAQVSSDMTRFGVLAQAGNAKTYEEAEAAFGDLTFADMQQFRLQPKDVLFHNNKLSDSDKARLQAQYETPGVAPVAVLPQAAKPLGAAFGKPVQPASASLPPPVAPSPTVATERSSAASIITDNGFGKGHPDEALHRRVAAKIAARTKGLKIRLGTPLFSGVAAISGVNIELGKGLGQFVEKHGEDAAIDFILSEELTHSALAEVLGKDEYGTNTKVWSGVEPGDKQVIEKAYFGKSETKTFKNAARVQDSFEDAISHFTGGKNNKKGRDTPGVLAGAEVLRMLAQRVMGHALTESTNLTPNELSELNAALDRVWSRLSPELQARVMQAAEKASAHIGRPPSTPAVATGGTVAQPAQAAVSAPAAASETGPIETQAFRGSRAAGGFSGAASAGLGTQFSTDSQEYAGRYGDVKEVGVKFANPYYMPINEFMAFDRGPGASVKKSQARATELTDAGHDGIVVTHRDGVKEFITLPPPSAQPAQAAVSAPAAASETPQTGKPFTATVYRGESRGGGGLQAQGAGEYFGLEQVVAERFSKPGTVKPTEVTLNNPLVIRSDAEMEAAKKQAEAATGIDFGKQGNLYNGWLSPHQSGPYSRYWQSQGHDGIVVDYKEAAGGRQVVKFRNTPPPSVAASVARTDADRREFRKGVLEGRQPEFDAEDHREWQGSPEFQATVDASPRLTAMNKQVERQYEKWESTLTDENPGDNGFPETPLTLQMDRVVAKAIEAAGGTVPDGVKRHLGIKPPPPSVAAKPSPAVEQSADTTLSPADVLKNAAIYRKPGENYNRNIADSASRLESTIARGHSDKMQRAGADELQMRMDIHGAPASSAAAGQEEPVYQDYSIEALKDAFNLTDEQAVAVDALVQSIGLDTSKIKVAKGGTAGEGALFQDGKQLQFKDNILESLKTWQNRGTPEQLKAHIAKTKGAKEYADWIGLDEFLRGKSSVTKDAVEAFVKANQVTVQEVQKGTRERRAKIEYGKDEDGDFVAVEGLKIRPIEGVTERQWAYSDYDIGSTADSFGIDPFDLMGAIQNKESSVLREGPTNTRHSQQQTPGGENYRELLLTLPSQVESDRQRLRDEAERRGYGDTISEWPDKEFADEYRRKVTLAEKPQSDFRSSHFDEPNILAHVRMNDRTDADGKKTLFIEEIQSDWHQAGRKGGYKGSNHYSPAEIRDLEIDRGSFAGYWSVWGKLGESSDLTQLSPNYSARTEAEKELSHIQANGYTNETGSVPNAPFKTTWPMLAFKRMVQFASENGYDQIAWTTGEQQNERYDLSKQVRNILYQKRNDGTVALDGTYSSERGGGMFGIDLQRHGNKYPAERPGSSAAIVPLADLEGIIGKDLALKIERGEGSDFNQGTRTVKELKGLDLKVGGEGMKGFYDRILPAEVNKYVKQWGGRVGQTKIEVEARPSKSKREAELGHYWHGVESGQLPAVTADEKKIANGTMTRSEFVQIYLAYGRSVETEQVHALTITPAMRASVTGQGQMLFQGEKGSAEFTEAGEAIIRGLESPNVDTALEEILHVGRRWILNRDVPAENRAGITDSDIDVIEKACGVKNGVWTVEAEERLPKLVRGHILSGQSKVGSKLRDVLNKIATWIAKIYENVKRGHTLKVSPKVAEVLDKFINRTATLQASTQSSVSSQPPTTASTVKFHYGKKTTIAAVGMDSIDAHFGVAELDSLQPSSNFNDGYPSSNQNYPANLQPRDYGPTSDNADKVRRFAAKYEPRHLLSDSADAVDGSPTVNQDGIVINGNGRVMTNQLVRFNNANGLDEYKQQLIEQAQFFGLDPAAVKAMKHPTLVRIVDLDVNSKAARDFAEAGNEETKQAQSPAETAKRIAALMPFDVIAKLDTADSTFSEAVNGDSQSATNFRREFYNAMPPSQLAAYFFPDGSLTEAGKELVRHTALQSIVDVKTYDAMTPQQQKLIDAAIPQLLQLRKTHPESDIGPALIEAIKFINANKIKDKADVADSVATVSMFAEVKLSPAGHMMADFVIDHGDKSTYLREALKRLLHDLGVTGRDMFGEEDGRTDSEKVAAAFNKVKLRPGAVFSSKGDNRGSKANQPSGRGNEAAADKAQVGVSPQEVPIVAKGNEELSKMIDDAQKAHDQSVDKPVAAAELQGEINNAVSDKYAVLQTQQSLPSQEAEGPPSQANELDEMMNAALDEALGPKSEPNRPSQKASRSRIGKVTEDSVDKAREAEAAAFKEFRDMANELGLGMQGPLNPKLATAAVKLIVKLSDLGIKKFADMVVRGAEVLTEATMRKLAPYLEAGWRLVKQRPGFENLDTPGSVADILDAKKPSLPESAAEPKAVKESLPVTELERRRDEAKAALEAIGREPPKPSNEAKRFGARGRAGADPAAVARYDDEVKTYNKWKRQYDKLKKAEVAANNAVFYAQQKSSIEPEVSEESPIKIESSPKASVTVGNWDTIKNGDHDLRLAISKAANHYTLWYQIPSQPGRPPAPWRYVRILGGNKAEALERAKQAAGRIASGDLTGLAFVGKEQIAVPKSIGLVEHELGPEQLMAAEHSPIGEQSVGFGKYSDTLVKDLFAKDPGYALWLAGSGSSGRGKQVADYLSNHPDLIASRDAEIAATQDAMTPESIEILKGHGIVPEALSRGGIVLRGKTYDWKDIIKSLGGKFSDGSWTVSPDGYNTLVAKLGGIAKPVGGQRGGVPAHQSNPAIGELRRNADARPDTSEFSGPVSEYISDETSALIERGRAIGMPEVVVNEQIEDVARINRAYQQGKPLFLLASEPGSGKTFVLGGAIRELQAAGAKKIVYVTLRSELIAQIKNDLKDYGIEGVEFVTYPAMRELQPSETDVLIFDEAHSIKNVGKGDEGAQQAAKAAEWIKQSKFTVLSTATPFENPVQAQYLQAAGVFEADFKDFKSFALAYGASTYTLKSGDDVMVWKRTGTSDADAAAAREYFRKEGIFTSRRIRLPDQQVDSRLVKVNVDAKAAATYAAFTAAAEENRESLAGFGAAWIVNFQKRLLEAAKVQHGITEAKAALKRGRFPIIFVETKAERNIDIPELIEAKQAWDLAVMEANKMGDRPPPRSDFGVPPPGVVETLATFMDNTGTTRIEIPSAEDTIKQALGEKQVAIFTGSVLPTKAQKNLDAWRRGDMPVLVATMAKGGTGLSLHDKVGDHQTTQININLPWTATQVVQVAQRSARYGLKGQAEMQWIFADNIPFDRNLSNKVGGRMADMGAVVHGEKLKDADKIEDWDFESKPFSENVADEPRSSSKEPAADGDKYFKTSEIDYWKDQPSKSREILIHMTPTEFLGLAKELPDPVASKAATVRSVLESGKPFNDIPYIGFTHNGKGVAQVVSHEGRHRALALQALGVKRIPVRLNSQTSKKGGDEIRWGEQDDERSHDRIKGDWPRVLRGESSGEIQFPVKDLRAKEPSESSEMSLPTASATAMKEAVRLGVVVKPRINGMFSNKHQAFEVHAATKPSISAMSNSASTDALISAIRLVAEKSKQAGYEGKNLVALDADNIKAYREKERARQQAEIDAKEPDEDIDDEEVDVSPVPLPDGVVDRGLSKWRSGVAKAKDIFEQNSIVRAVVNSNPSEKELDDALAIIKAINKPFVSNAAWDIWHANNVSSQTKQDARDFYEEVLNPKDESDAVPAESVEAQQKPVAEAVSQAESEVQSNRSGPPVEELDRQSGSENRDQAVEDELAGLPDIVRTQVEGIDELLAAGQAMLDSGERDGVALTEPEIADFKRVMTATKRQRGKVIKDALAEKPVDRVRPSVAKPVVVTDANRAAAEDFKTRLTDDATRAEILKSLRPLKYGRIVITGEEQLSNLEAVLFDPQRLAERPSATYDSTVGKFVPWAIAQAKLVSQPSGAERAHKGQSLDEQAADKKQELNDALEELKKNAKKAARDNLGAFVPLDAETFRSLMKVTKLSLEIGGIKFRQYVQSIAETFGGEIPANIRSSLVGIWNDIRETHPVYSKSGMAEATDTDLEAGIADAKAEEATDGDGKTVDELLDSDYVSTQNKYAAKVREELGMPERGPVDLTGHTWEDLNEQAAEIGPGRAVELLVELGDKTRPPRAASDLENFILLRHLRTLQNDRLAAAGEIAEAREAGESAREAMAETRLDVLDAQLKDFVAITEAIGTPAGRLLAARKAFLAMDYSLPKLEYDIEKAQQRPMTKEERSELKDLHAKYEALKKHAEEVEAKYEELKAQEHIDDAIQVQTKPEPTRKQKVHVRFNKAAKSFFKHFATAHSLGSFSPEAFADAVELAKASVELGVATVQDFVDSVTKMFGRALTTDMDAALRKAHGQVVAESKNPPKLDFDAENANSLRRAAQEIMRHFIGQGMTNRDKLIDAVHSEFKSYLPKITRREAMLAMSGYGDIRPATTNQIEITRQDVNGQIQAVLKLEDMAHGIAPLHSGQQRNPQSDEKRRLEQQVNEEKRKGGFVTLDPEMQLKSSLQARETWLRHRMEDLRFEISKGQRTVKTKTPTPTSPAIKALQAEYDLLKAEHLAVFGKRELTDKQKLELATKHAAKHEAFWADQLAKAQAGQFPTAEAKKPPITSPELEAIRAKTKAAQAEFKRLDDAAHPEKKEDARYARAKANVEHWQQRLKDAENGLFQPAKAKTEDSTGVTLLKSLAAHARAQAKELDDAAHPDRVEQLLNDRYLTSLMRQKVEIESRIANNDVAPKVREERKLPPEVLKARHERDQATAKLDVKKELARLEGRKTPERILDGVREGVNLIRDHRMNYDMGVGLLQGGAHFFSHPVNWWTKALPAGITTLFSKDSAAAVHAINEMIHEMPNAKNGLFDQMNGLFSQDGVALTRREELVLGSWLYRVPVLGRVAKRFSHAGGAFLNVIRAHQANFFLATVADIDGRVSSAAAKVVGKQVGMFTGRGDMGTKAVHVLGELNLIFNATQWVVSRFQLALLKPLWMKNGTPGTLRAAQKEYGRLLMGLTGLYLAALAMSAASDDEDDQPILEPDPRSTDLLKLKFGGWTIDPLFGLQQAIVLMARLATKQKKDRTGKILPLTAGGKDLTVIFAEFARGKLHPFPSFVNDMYSGQDITGEKVNWDDAPRKLGLPLTGDQILKTFDPEHIPASTARSVGEWLGARITQYETRIRSLRDADAEFKKIDKSLSQPGKTPVEIQQLNRRRADTIDKYLVDETKGSVQKVITQMAKSPNPNQATIAQQQKLLTELDRYKPGTPKPAAIEAAMQIERQDLAKRASDALSTEKDGDGKLKSQSGFNKGKLRSLHPDAQSDDALTNAARYMLQQVAPNFNDQASLVREGWHRTHGTPVPDYALRRLPSRPSPAIITQWRKATAAAWTKRKAEIKAGK